MWSRYFAEEHYAVFMAITACTKEKYVPNKMFSRVDAVSPEIILTE